MVNDKSLGTYLGAFIIGLFVELVILFLYFGIYGKADDEGWGFFLIVAVSIIAFISASSISDKSPNVEISKKFGIAQGAAMIFPVIWVGSLDSYPVAFTILFVIALILYICGTIEIYNLGEWNSSLGKLALSFVLQSIYAFAFAICVGFLIALIFALVGGDKRKKKRKKAR